MLPFIGPALANPRQSLQQMLNFGLVLSSAFMMWKTLSVIADSPSPIVVVLSGSMEPAFQRGDLLFLWNRDRDAQVGEIVVYNVKGKDIPIVHRVVRSYANGDVDTVQVDATGKTRHRSASASARGSGKKLLTKGDNNVADDTELYARGQSYLDRDEDIIGSVRGYVPTVGYVTIMLSEHPWLKQVMLALMGLTVILQRE
ncbi:hypothetical protein DV736_g5292, partial [Chaetothyriales sp. CBS 134916]